MKRALTVTALLAMGVLVASSFAAAQDAPASTSGGQVTLSLLGRSDVSSSKFEEYREVPKGLSIPFLNLFSTTNMVDFNLQAYNVRQTDQRYSGWANTSWLGVAFDYNQTPHNMGNDGHSIFQETALGVWSMSSSLRQALGDAADKTASAGRTYPFFSALLAPTFASAGNIDLTSMRQRGNVELDLGKKLPFDLKFTYMRELKTGTRGYGGGDILGSISPVVDVPEPLNEVTQDFGIRAAYNFKMGNVHAAFNRNVYDNQAETLSVNSPFRASDVAYTTATSIPGGGAGTVRFINAPDNEATGTTFGFLLKFKRQTRIAGDVSMATWTQNASFYPYTINSTILTGTGQPANLLSSLQKPSLNGKIDTTTVNFSFSSRPIDGLGLRMRYRSYDLTNKTARFVITGDTSGTPDRSWGAADTPTADEPYGHATAQNYDTKTERFDASASYDFKGITFEGAFRTSKLTRTFREAPSGKENGASFSAVYHANDFVGVRATIDQTNRTAEGYATTTIGLMVDEAERKTTRTGFEIELTPASGLGLTFAYFRRNTDYPNRPGRVAGDLNTTSGLLEAKYDTFTGEFEYAPSERAEFSVYYTYEKDAQTNRWSTLTSGAINNLLNYAGTDKTNTFGVNAMFQLVPDKWTFSLMARQQKVDGLMDITARETGSFYTPGRTTLVAAGTGGAQDINDWDDTTLTTAGLQLDRMVGKAWKLSLGYAYEKYDFADAYSVPYTGPASLMPQSVLIFMKTDSGPYKASVGYAKLSYRF